MLPVHIIKKPKDKESVVLPPDSLCYLIGSNGMFRRTINDFYEVTRKLESLPGLGTIDPKVRLYVKKLPYRFIREAAAFFAAVYKEQQSEAIVLLYCHPKFGWHMDAPIQSAVGLHVDYDMKNLPTEVKGYILTRYEEVEENGVKSAVAITRVSKEPKTEGDEVVTEEFAYRLFGTIHSHASAGAFHSGTDDKDEQHFDGLHITIGNVNVPAHTYSSRWMLAGEFYKADMHQVAEDPPEGFFDERWLKRVTKRSYNTTYAGGVSGNHGGPSSYHGHQGAPFSRDGSHSYQGPAADTSPMDAEMGGWWPGGPGGPPKGGVAPSGGTFRRPSAEGSTEKGAATTLPDGRPATGMEPGTPTQEARLRQLTLFMDIKDAKYQRNYFERLETKWKNYLVQDLAMYHPTEAASFLRGVGVVLRKSLNGGSDASSPTAAEKTESTTSPNPSRSNSSGTPTQNILPPPVEVRAEDPEAMKDPRLEEYTEGDCYGY